jgi:hypothetical protein
MNSDLTRKISVVPALTLIKVMAAESDCGQSTKYPATYTFPSGSAAYRLAIVSRDIPPATFLPITNLGSCAKRGYVNTCGS